MQTVPVKLGVALEYLLPGGRRHRPDVLLFAPGIVYVLEFKGYGSPEQPHVEQASFYARDLRMYHNACTEILETGEERILRKVQPLLVLAKKAEYRREERGVLILGSETLVEYFSEQDLPTDCTRQEMVDFLTGLYTPLPSVVSGARAYYLREPLPRIHRALSSNIPEVLERLTDFSRESCRRKAHSLVFVTGIPGAGKTLLGLRLVYDTEELKTVYFSGNGALVKVLRHALGKDSDAFVQHVNAFLKRREVERRESVWVYDEGQRAWNGLSGQRASQPFLLLQAAEKQHKGCVLVVLLGEGQELFLGEAGGVEKWTAVLRQAKRRWNIVFPPQFDDKFRVLQGRHFLKSEPCLHLDESLRTHRASELQAWVEAVLKGDRQRAAESCQALRSQDYPLYITRHLNTAKQYLQRTFEEEPEKQFGILLSSRAKKFLAESGLNSSAEAIDKVKKNMGLWYNQPTGSKGSSNNLDTVATEFLCQGLELDAALVAWGLDFRWDAHKREWLAHSRPENRKLCINSYRVLLTRARDFMVLYLPPASELDSTFDFLVEAGCQTLQRASSHNR